MSPTPRTASAGRSLRALWCRLASGLALALLVAAACLAGAAFGSGTLHARASRARLRCVPRRSQTIARAGPSVLFLRQTGLDDGKYGAPHSLLGCRSARQAPVQIYEFEDGDRPSEVASSFAGPYAAFFLGWASTVCSFYESAGAEHCGRSLFESVNLRTGRARLQLEGEASSEAERPRALLVTQGGWIAWVPGGAAPGAPLLAQDSKGQRTLDAGPIDARSLRASGSAVRWSDGGVAHTARLG
jgi:hypothetical protein